LVQLSQRPWGLFIFWFFVSLADLLHRESAGH
jgi:hypothetical protein